MRSQITLNILTSCGSNVVKYTSVGGGVQSLSDVQLFVTLWTIFKLSDCIPEVSKSAWAKMEVIVGSGKIDPGTE